jgi:serine/threonine protein phosphatase PrpC
MLVWAKAIEAEGARLEDRAEVIVRAGQDELIVVVADGVGGRSGGAAAAEAVVELARSVGARTTPWPNADEWCEILTKLDKTLAGTRGVGETTAVVVTVGRGRVEGASIGDSGAWLSGDRFVDLTRGQQRKPYVGSGQSLPVPFAAAMEGTLLVATDGLLKYAPLPTVREIMAEGDVERAAARLVDSARLPTGKLWDDVAVVVCRAASE